MNVEIELKNYILSRYKSIRAFTKDIDIPYSTIDTMIKRGIGGTGINTIIKICKALSLDAESLADGLIVEKQKLPNYNDYNENHLITSYRKLNVKGQAKLLEYSEDLVNSGNYIDSAKKEEKLA